MTDNTTGGLNMSTTATVPAGPGGPDVDLRAVVIAFTILQSIVLVISTLGNLLVIVAISCHMDTKKATNKFIINLAVADFLTGIDMVYQITTFYVPNIGSHLVTCLLQFQTISVFVLSSQLSIVFCTVDRFIAITYPFRHDTIMTSRNTAIMLSVPWVYGIAVGILPFAGLNNWVEGLPCIYGLVVTRAQLFIAAITTWVQSLVCVVMYSVVLKVAWTRKRRIRPQNGNQIKHRDVKSGITMGIVTIAFTVCWFPFSVTTFMQTVAFDPTVAFVGNVLVFIGVAHSMVNPFIYAWQKSEFRRACHRLFCKRSSAVHHASQRQSVRTVSRHIEKSDPTMSMHRGES